MIEDKYSENAWKRWHTPDYIRGSFGPNDGKRHWELVFEETFKHVPKNIDTVVDLGCAAGRNLYFYSHQDQIKNLIGIDISDEIDFYPMDNFTYIKSLISDWRPRFTLENTLIISHGCLMYYDFKAQIEMINNWIELGCENFIFQEYDKKTLDNDYPQGKETKYLPLPIPVYECALEGLSSEKYKFSKKWHRKEIPAYIRLCGEK